MSKENLKTIPLRMSGMVPRSQAIVDGIEIDHFNLHAEENLVFSGIMAGYMGKKSPLSRIEKDGERLGLEDLLPDEQVNVEDEAIRNIEGSYFKDGLERLLQKLTPRQRRIIELRFGFSGTPQTLKVIGQELGISPQRVEVIEKKAINRLQNFAPVIFNSRNVSL